MDEVKLSICIATFRRGDYIAETLDCLAAQLSDGVELVIVDGCSPDRTPEVVAPYAERVETLRYYRESENSGVDADYDKAVGYARGRHVWLMTDDDLLVEGAVDRVLGLLEAEDPDLLVVDSSVLDVRLDGMLQRRRFGFTGLRTYGPGQSSELMADGGDALSFIGGTIVRRELWEARDRRRYYGTLFVHVGVIFQAPIQKAIMLGEPLVQIRFGNAMWGARGFEIWMFMWPALIWSFEGISETAKARVTAREPWRIARKLLGFRANGSYDRTQYNKHFSARSVGIWRIILLAFALFPGRFANVLAVALLLTQKGRYRAACYGLAQNSKFAGILSQKLAAQSPSRHSA